MIKIRATAKALFLHSRKTWVLFARFFATTVNFLRPDLLPEKYGNRSKDNRAPSEITAIGVDELTIIIVKLQRNFEAPRFKEAILSNA